MKKIRCFISGVLALTLILTVTVTTMAAGTTTSQGDASYHDISNSSTENCTVSASQASSFSVSIPKNIVLNGSDGTAVYTVIVSGNISGTEVLSVRPDSVFTLSQPGKSNLNATVGQFTSSAMQSIKTTWAYSELAAGSTAYGYISVASSAPVTAGSWSGTFDFIIHLD
jgi:hypothetical protein